MRIKSLKQTFFNHIKNLSGPSVDNKILVLDCDDWGSIRMPSKAVYQELIRLAPRFITNRYNQYDTLADTADLDALFHVLQSVKDRYDNPVVMTAFCNVANPDFGKIKDSGYTKYYYEPFTVTHQKYYNHTHIIQKWQEGISKAVFSPELHGREHISVHEWLQSLQSGDTLLKQAFDLGFVHLTTTTVHPIADQFRPQFFFKDFTEVEELRSSIGSATQIFNEIFKTLPSIFVPSNSVFHPTFYKDLTAAGINYVNVSNNQPVPDGRGSVTIDKRWMLPVDPVLKFYKRNAIFEPSDRSYGGVDYTLRQIGAAFNMKKPAVVSTHRVNFVGGICEENRDNGLKELLKLLNKVKNTWPDVTFMSTSKMLSQIYE